MRKVVFLLLIISSPLYPFAQLPDESFAPDFELQDLNGNIWHLYELLDQGKNVIIDISATWCGPCWSYHHSGELNKVYSAYGPDGTDEYMVFLIEGDPKTNIACLYDLPECSGGTGGDWTEGTLFPIINDDFIAWEYDISYWPTHYHICPNKLVTQLFNPRKDEIYALKDQCLVAQGNNNASIVEYAGFSGTFCGSVTVAPSIKVRNLGNDTLRSLTAECFINDTLHGTISWTGEVIPYAFFHLSFDSVTISENALINVRIPNVNGGADDEESDNEVTADFMWLDAIDQNMLDLELTTGQIPGYVYWEVANSDSTILYHGGNESVVGLEESDGAYSVADTTYIFSIPLPGDGCYRISLYDQYGHGLGIKNFRIKDPNANTVAEGEDFGEYTHILLGVYNTQTPIVSNGALLDLYGLSDEICRNHSYTLSADLFNLGTEVIVQAEIEILDDGNILHEMHWEGEIPPGETGTIFFPEVSFTSKEIALRIKSINGHEDIFPYKNKITPQVSWNFSNEISLKLEIQLDAWGYENYWQITNSLDEVLYSGGNTLVGPNGGGTVEAHSYDPGAYDSHELVVEEFVFADSTNECYTFRLVDGFGDGIKYGGFVRISGLNSGKEIFYKDYFWIDFDYAETLIEIDPLTTSFKTPDVPGSVALFPNPVQSFLYLKPEPINLTAFSLAVVNALGEPVLHYPKADYLIADDRIKLDVRSLVPGVYYLYLVNGTQQLTHTFAVMR